MDILPIHYVHDAYENPEKGIARHCYFLCVYQNPENPEKGTVYMYVHNIDCLWQMNDRSIIYSCQIVILRF